MVPQGAEQCPGLPPPGVNNQLPLALFDVQFVYNVEDSAGQGGMAGVAYTGTEFWVSSWANDTLFTFNPVGTCTDTFTIPTITDVRALTFDGTYLYAVNNTDRIYKINPATKSLVSSFTVASMTQIRHCAFDPTADGGAGGFWVGNWATDLVQIDLTGNLLQTIPAATHTLTSMYGSAVDTVTSGGPYLWIFHQGGTSQSNLARIKLPTGNLTVAAHDVMTDVGPLGGATSGLAGGLFITDAIASAQWTIVGILQGSPNNLLFGYELNDFIPPAVDASIDTLRMDPVYTRIPFSHASNLSFDGRVSNTGLNTLNTVNFNVTVKRGAATVYTDMQSTNNLASGAAATLSSGTFTPSQTGTYDCYGTVTLTGQTDLLAANDSLEYQFLITDSTYARDNNVPNGNAYNVAGTDWALVTTNFTIPIADTLTSVSIQLETPVAGDTTYAVVYSTDLGVPQVPLGQTPATIIGAGNNYVLVFPNGVGLAPGEYAIGVYEGQDASIGLAQSPSVFTPGVNYVYTPTNGWFPSGIQTARFIRPNFGNVSFVSREDAIPGASVNLYPNPAQTMVNVEVKNTTASRITISNLLGETLSSLQGKGTLTTLSVEDLAPGLYFITVETPLGTAVKKFTVQ